MMNMIFRGNNDISQFSLSVVSDSVTPWTAAHQASLSITNFRSLLKFTSNNYLLWDNIHVLEAEAL